MKQFAQLVLAVGLVSVSCTTLAAHTVSMKLALDPHHHIQTQTFDEALDSGKAMCQASLPQDGTATILGQDGQKLATLYGKQASSFQLNSAQPLMVQIDPIKIIHIIFIIGAICTATHSTHCYEAFCNKFPDKCNIAFNCSNQ